MRIVYITGSRADYGRVKYLLNDIKKDDLISLEIIVCGMHLLQRYGMTINEIEKDFNINYKVNVLIDDNKNSSMSISFGKEIIEFTKILKEISPDYLLVLGDRGEMLAGAISAKHLNIPVIHIGGGHISGSIDNNIRDSITIFSDYHFVATKKGRKRVINMGAKKENVFIVGASDLDAIKRKDYSNRSYLIKKYNLNLDQPLILAQMHPITNETDKSQYQINQLLDALKIINIQTFMTYPNADSGGNNMIKILENKRYDFLKIHKSIPYQDYLGIMNIAKLMVGNSSAGIIEAPSFNLPVINIGTRQINRERAKNVIDIGYSKNEIIKAIKKVLNNPIKKFINPYGNGNTSKKILKVIKNLR